MKKSLKSKVIEVVKRENGALDWEDEGLEGFD
jgi:hypothetical protein